MRAIVVVSVAWLLAASAVRAQEAPKYVYVDIQPQAKGKTKDLQGVPKGEQTFAGVKLKIGAGVIGVSVERDPRKPPGKVEGIKVGTTCRKLHFLHACHGSSHPDDIIGYYTVNYEDLHFPKLCLFGSPLSESAWTDR